MQSDFWVKNGALGENGHPKGLWVKIGALGEMAVQKDFWVKMGFRRK